MKHKAALLFVIIALLAVLGILDSPAYAQTPVDTGYRDFLYSSSGVSAPTGEKPQSKLWFNNGLWWGSFFNRAAGVYTIYRFITATQTWTNTGVIIDNRPSARIDTLWDGTNLYTLGAGITAGNSAQVRRYSYNAGSNTYSLDAGFPVTVSSGGMEASVIGKDSTGTLWVTFTQGSRVYVNHSNGDDLTWVTPYVLPVGAAANVTSDDISSIQSFGGNKLGVFWANQNTGGFYFAIHNDGDADTSWTLETALIGTLIADDHFNLKTDSAGIVYAAIKTSVSDSTAFPPTASLLRLLVRSAGGTWRWYNYSEKSFDQTRPIVLLDESTRTIYMFATIPVGSPTAGAIYFKQTSMDSIAFPAGIGTPFIQSSGDTHINNATSTKQNLDCATGILVAAGGNTTQYYFHNYASCGFGTLPDLRVTKTNNVSGVVNVGGSWQWTLTVQNVGPGEARFASGEAILRDNLPGTVTYSGLSTTNLSGISGTGTITCNIVSNVLSCNASGGSVAIAAGTGRFDAVFTATPSIDGSFRNPTGGICRVDPDNWRSETTETNNNCSDTVVVNPSANLSVTKSDNVDPVTGGSSLAYTVQVTNNGPSDATNVVVTDTLPAGVTFVSTTGCAGDPSGVPNCSLGTVPVGSSRSYVVRVNVNSGTTGTLTNRVDVSSSTTSDPDPTDNRATQDTAVITSANLSITEQDNTDPVVAGNNLTYTIQVTNNGPSNATNVVVTDTLPAGVTFVSSPSCTALSGVLTCSLGNVAAGGSASFPVQVTVNSGTTGTISNIATVNSSTSDPDTSDNTANQDTTVITRANLSITKSDSPDPVIIGDDLTYTIRVTNAGPSNATNVMVTDVLPARLTLVSSSGCAEDPNGAPTCSLGTVAAGSSKSYTLVVRVNAGPIGTVTNSVSVTSDVFDPNTSNNTASQDTFATLLTDLSITKVDNVDPVVAGNNLTYTIRVTNGGPGNAPDVVVTDTLPAGVVLISTSGCAEDPDGTPDCSLGAINAGASAVYTVTVAVDANTIGTITNIANVIGNTTIDPDASNNRATQDTTVIAHADLGITKTDSVDPVIAGNTLTYTLQVTNNGPSTARNVVVTDTLPTGVTLVSTSGCAGDPNGVPTCSLGTLAVGASASYTIRVTVDSGTTGTLSNRASAASSAIDPTASNNTATQTTVVTTSADLRITKTDSVDPVIAGNILTYTVRVTNSGPSDAVNVVVTDTLPAGVTLVSTSGCAGDPNGVPTCSLGTVVAGASASYTIRVTVDSGTTGTITNNASVTSSTPDPNTANNTATQNTAVNSRADLSIIKTDNVDPVEAGNNLTYTVQVTNNGPSDAINVVVTDTLPAGVTLVSTAGCAEDPNGVPTCSLGTIVAGSSASYTIQVSIGSSTVGTITNRATVTSGTTDPTASNNTANQSTVVTTRADLSITKMDSVDPVTAGNTLSYTIQVTNAGPGDAVNVVVSDTLPTGVTLVSTSGCAGDPNGVPTCSLGTIVVGTSASYTIQVTVNSGTTGTITNSASVTSSAIDPDTSNNTATQTTTVNSRADLRITKTDSVDPVIAGNILTYTVRVTNNGPSDAVNVVVTDTLPAGVTLVSTNGCAEDPNGVPTCSLGTIAAGASASYTIRVRVASGATGTLTNTARVTSGTLDPDTTNNTASQATAVNASANLSITKVDNIDPVPVGSNLIYTVQVTNNGPSDAVNVVVTDTLPAGVTLVSTNGCAGDPNGVPTCSLGTIVAGSSASYTIEVVVDATSPLTITNRASVTSGANDPDTSNNTVTQTTTTVPNADLVITKIDNPDPVIAGNTLTYTLQVTNNGPNTATNVVVTDTLPTGVTFVSTSGCAGDPNGVPTCSLGTLLAGASASYTIQVTVNSGTTGTITNSASVTTSAGDPDNSNNTATQTTTVNSRADLSITKTDSVDPVIAGNILTYTVRVTNNGPSDAVNVVVRDTLPAGVTLVSTTGCAGDPNGVPTCSLGTIAAGGSASYTIRVRVASGATGTLTNNASVTSSTPDPDTSNNTATETTTVNTSADLSITKTDSADPIGAGSILTYTIRVTNNGPSDATTVVVTDTLPTGVTFVSTAGCAGDPNGVPTCSLGRLTAGSTVSYTIRVAIPSNATGTITNAASVTSTVADPDITNNTATQATVVNTSADLSITKTDSADPVIAGNILTYTVRVTNSGPSDATTVVVTDTLPAGVTLVSTAGCAEDPNGVPTCSLGTLLAGASASYTVQVTVNSGTTGTITNSASVTSSAGDPDTSNNTATQTTTVNSRADLSITKTDSIDPVIAGNTLTYTIQVTNSGPSDATNVVVTDTLPAGVTLVSTAGCAGDPNGVPACSLGTIAAGASASYTVQVTVNSGTTGTITNRASVASSATDPTASNNTATQTTTVNSRADLSITKTDSIDPVIAGNTLTYTIRVTNNGTSDAVNVVVRDTLPAGVTLVSTAGCAGDPNGVPTCSLGTLATGSSVSYTIQVVVASGATGTLTNNASVTSTVADPDTTNNTATQDTAVTTSADLSITKTDSADPVVAGSTLTYTIRVTNNGPSNTSNVVVTDTLPTGVTLVSTNGCAEDPNGIPTCSLGTLAAGASASYTVQVTVDSGTIGTIINSASVTSSAGDPDTSNNTVTQTTTAVPNADLIIAKIDNPDPVIAGNTLTYTLQVTNNGPNTATNVVVTDTLPTGVTFVSTTGCAGDPNGVPTCSLGTIAAGASASYTIQVTVNSGTTGTITNSASVTSSAGDPNNSNNTATQTTTVNSRADLSITKTDSVDPVIAGNILTYTVRVTNNGPSDAVNVVVRDTLPAGVTLVSTTGCAGDPNGVPTCSLGTLATGSSVSYTIQVVVASGATGTLTNNASVTSSTPDPDTSSNTATETTTVNTSADLSITKTDSADPIGAGSTLTYTIQVTNNGPSDATTVVVTDTLPTGVTFVSTAGCTGDPNGVPTCSLGTLVAGSTVSYTIRVAIPSNATGTITNSASVTSTVADPDTTNNTATQDTAVTTSADLSITKTDSADPVIAGSTLTYTIRVTNNGPSDATNVVVTDTLPAGVTLVSTAGCAEDPNGVPTCSLGTLLAGASASYTVQVTVNGTTSGTITNSASVTSSAGDPDTSNNTATQTTTVNSRADLSITKTDSIDSVIAGNTLTYTIQVTNSGPSDATNVVVTDTLPAGVTFVSTAGCAEDPNGVPTCSLGTIAAGASASYTVQVTVNSGTTGTITNRASVTSSATDSNTSNNTAAQTTTVTTTADLSITKTDSIDPVIAGNTLTYTIQVINNGPSDATNVVVRDTLPAGVTFVSTAGCAGDPNGVPACSFGTIAAGASASYTVQVTVNSGTTGTITNTASVTSTVADPDTSNNTATQDTAVTTSADLSITKTDSADPVVAGSTLTYTIRVTNNGPSNTSNVVVTDTLPTGVTLVSTAGCAGDPNGVPTCSLGTIAAGASASYTVQVTVNGTTSGTITNSASVTSSIADPDTSNNTVTQATLVAVLADLRITKTDSIDPVIAGNTLTYTIQVTNGGPNDATNVVVTDTLPAGVTLVSTTGCTGDPNGVPTCSLGTIAAGASASYTIQVTVNSGTTGTITNSADVSSDAVDANTSNNTAAQTTTVNSRADLSITKTDSIDPVIAGNTLTYTIQVTNNGPSDAVNVVVRDTLPTGVTFVSTAGCAGDPNGVPTCSLGTLATGSSVSYTIQVVVASGATGTLTNNTSVTSSTPDPDTSNNTATETTTVNTSADLSITKTDSADPIGAGSILTYTIQVTNNGPSDATTVVVTDTLPTGVTFVSTAGCAGDPNGVPTCSLGRLTAGTSVSYTIRVAIPSNATGTITNAASVTSTVADPDTTNNTVTQATLVTVLADLNITKTDSADPVIAGSTLTYTIRVTNSGPSDATNVVVTDTLPVDVTLVSTAGCAEDPNGVPTCSLGTLLAGASASYTVQVTVNGATSGTITNSASVTSSIADPDTSNNTVTQATLVTVLADLSITKLDDLDPVIAGSILTYTIQVTNVGPGDATNVVVTDTLPAGATLVSTAGCAGDPNGVPTCSLGTIAAGASASYTVQVTVNSGTTGTITNSANVSSDAVDANTSNNTATQTTTVTTSADLSITKTDSADPIGAGSTLTYTIQVTNNGPSDATTVVVTDTLPTGVTFVSTAGCTGDPNGVPTCSLGTLVAGSTASYTIRVAIPSNATGTITNSASVTSTVADPDTTNNTATQDTAVTTSADLSITKTDSADPVIAGSTLTYTIRVTNNGPSNTSNVVVTDTLPAGVTLVSTTGCAGDPNGVPTCSLGTLAAGTSASYTVQVTVDSGTIGTITNTASVTSSIADPDTSNNTVTQATLVTVLADLSITKLDDLDPVITGNTLTYTIQVTNVGPGDATNVVVTDTLPAGVTLVSTAGCAGDPNGVPTCSLGTLLAGTSASYTVQVLVNSSATGTITNSANVSSDAVDANTSNNTATQTTTVTTTADLSIVKTASVNPATAGANLTYTIQVTNNGPSDATNVVVTDTLPAGVTLVSTAGCAGDPNGIPSCTLGTVAAGSTASYTIQVTVNSNVNSALTNSASVNSSVTDPNPANNTAVQVTNVSTSADLSLIKSVNNPNPVLGSNFTYTIRVTNNGSSDATNVVVTDTLPAGVTLVSTSGCAEPVGVPACTLGTIAAGASASYDITVTANSAPAINTAEISSVDQNDPDSTPNNGNASEDDQDSITVPQAVADLELSKSIDNPTPIIGDTLIFTLTVTNRGPDTATNTEVTDVLPDGYTYVSDDGGADTNVSGNSVIWTIPTLPNGSSAQLQITATVTSGGNYNNITQVTDSDQFDSDSAPANDNGNQSEDDEARVNVRLQAPAVSITKTSQATANRGDNVNFFINVANAGNADLTGIVVSDPLCAPLNQTSNGNGDTTLNVAETWTYECTVNNVQDTFTNTATVTTAEGPTDSAAATVKVGSSDPSLPVADASTPAPNIIIVDPFITKSVNPPFAVPGEAVTWTIEVRNPSSQPAFNVRIVDNMPPEVAIVSVSATLGNISTNGQTVTWSIAQLNPGDAVTIIINSRVRDNVALPFIISNEAIIYGDNLDSAQASATLISLTKLPATGESPWSPIRLPLLVGFAMLVLGIFYRLAKRLRGSQPQH